MQDVLRTFLIMLISKCCNFLHSSFEPFTSWSGVEHDHTARKLIAHSNDELIKLHNDFQQSSGVEVSAG